MYRSIPLKLIIVAFCVLLSASSSAQDLDIKALVGILDSIEKLRHHISITTDKKLVKRLEKIRQQQIDMLNHILEREEN